MMKKILGFIFLLAGATGIISNLIKFFHTLPEVISNSHFNHNLVIVITAEQLGLYFVILMWVGIIAVGISLTKEKY